MEWSGVERRGVYPLKIDGRDEPNPTAEPNPTHVQNSGRGKARPDFPNRPHSLASKFGY